MTYNEMATIIAHYMGDPTSIPFREEAKRIINVWRSTLIRQSLEKNPLDRRYFTQTIYRDLVHTTLPSCPDVPQICPFLRTQFTVPTPLRANGIYYDYIGNFNRKASYPLIDTVQVPSYAYNKYTGKRPYVFNQDNFLYLVNEESLSCLMIVGIFDSLSLSDCSHDLEFPCPLDIQQRILQVIEQEVRLLPRIKDSEINVTPDDTAEKQAAAMYGRGYGRQA